MASCTQICRTEKACRGLCGSWTRWGGIYRHPTSPVLLLCQPEIIRLFQSHCLSFSLGLGKAFLLPEIQDAQRNPIPGNEIHWH